MLHLVLEKHCANMFAKEDVLVKNERAHEKALAILAAPV